MHTKFGEPTLSGVNNDGEQFEEFRTHRKLRDPVQAASCRMAFAWTWGMSEVVAVPGQLVGTGYYALVGRTVRFTYDRDGTVSGVRVDGDTFWDPYRPSLASSFPLLPRDDPFIRPTSWPDPQVAPSVKLD